MKLRFHFDYGSPYAYLGWQRIRQHPERYEAADIEWIPVSAGHIFKQDGTRPNVTYPNQNRYLREDCQRWARHYGVPFDPPAPGEPGEMPVNAMGALRLHFAAREQTLEKDWMEAVFLGYFQHGRNLSDPDVLQKLAKEVGVDVGGVADQVRWKQALIDATGAAYAVGCPGVPFVVLDTSGGVESFWGQDRLAWVEARLAGSSVIA